jgi:hypothetical protein
MSNGDFLRISNSASKNSIVVDRFLFHYSIVQLIVCLHASQQKCTAHQEQESKRGSRVIVVIHVNYAVLETWMAARDVWVTILSALIALRSRLEDRVKHPCLQERPSRRRELGGHSLFLKLHSMACRMQTHCPQIQEYPCLHHLHNSGIVALQASRVGRQSLFGTLLIDLAPDPSALFDSFDFTSSLGNFNTTHPFLDVAMTEDPWPVPTSPPVASHDSIIDPRLRSASQAKDTTNKQSPLERLSGLQQELLRTRLPSAHTRESGTQHQPAKCVENAMKPVQETLGVVTDLLHQCVKKGGDERNSVCSDWQTVLHLVLTPLSLLLSTYDQILHEIRNASSSSTQNRGCALFDSVDCRVAGLRLDPPLRLILLATVVDYQLKHLYQTVRTFQSKFMHSSSLGIADCMSSATMAEVQSTIRSLLSVTRNTLQQS